MFDLVDRYNIKTGEWEKKDPEPGTGGKPKPRYGHSAALDEVRYMVYMILELT